MKYLVHLASTQSVGVRPSSAQYILNQQIVNATQLRVVSFSYANQLWNVVAGANTLVFDTGNVTVPEGHYSFGDLINYINESLLTLPASVANLTGSDAVVLSSQNTALWSIGDNVLQSGGLYPTFLLNVGLEYSGNFETLIWLPTPLAIALNSASFQGPNRFVTTAPLPTSSPFYIEQVTSSYGEISSSEASIDLGWKTPLGHENLSLVSIIITDVTSGRELVEMSHYSLLLEISTD